MSPTERGFQQFSSSPGLLLHNLINLNLSFSDLRLWVKMQFLLKKNEIISLYYNILTVYKAIRRTQLKMDNRHYLFRAERNNHRVKLFYTSTKNLLFCFWSITSFLPNGFSFLTIHWYWHLNHSSSEPILKFWIFS